MSLTWPNGSTTIPRVTSEFNPARKHPITGKVQPHRGIDLAGWAQVVAPADGVVTTNAFQAGGAGNYVNIAADGGVVFKFFHLAARSALKVGQQVKAGTVIGSMGMTGSATGVHLHYETWVNGTAVNPRDFYAGRLPGSVAAAHTGDDDMEKVLSWIDTVHKAVLGVKADVATVHNTVIAQGKRLEAVEAELKKVRPDINTVHQAVLRVERKG